MTRVYSRNALAWHGDVLRLDRRELARLVADARWPGMWRVRLPDGRLSDMANRARAKDAALSLALAALNREQGTEEMARQGPRTCQTLRALAEGGADDGIETGRWRGRPASEGQRSTSDQTSAR